MNRYSTRVIDKLPVDNYSESQFVDYEEEEAFYITDVMKRAHSMYVQNILNNLKDTDDIQANDEELEDAFSSMTLTGWLSYVDLKITEPFILTQMV